MSVKWTEEQQKVIDLRDRNILVSAAAGSGKTAVLVERIISRITAGKCESGAAVHIDPQCVDHDNPQFLPVGDPGSFSCDWN